MRFLLLSPLLLLAACPEQTGLQCPPNTGTIGQYALNLAGTHDAGECLAAADAGTDAGPLALTLNDGGTRSATFCLGTSDGGPELQLLVAGKGGVRKSALLADGGFRFVSDPVLGQGTVCVCDAFIAETFEGFLTANGPVSLQPDGGLPPIDGLTATLVDRLTAAGETTSCRCAFPCTVTYSVSGARF
jgi:hypothetical protein